MTHEVRRAFLGGLTALALVAAAPASASAGPWPLGAGRVWTKLTLFFHRTDELFWRRGERIPIFNDGHSTNFALFADIVIGLHDRVDLWLQAPVMALFFEDAAADRNSIGPGDLRVMVRTKLLELAAGRAPVSLRLGAKAPTGDFEVDPEVIPVGEGQWDLEAAVELGLSLWPRPGYVALDAGHRWRTENRAARREPGDEKFLLLDAGYGVVGNWTVKIVIDALFGAPLAEAGFAIPSSNREYVFVQPGLGYELGDRWFVELGVRVPAHGRNFPAGPQWLAGVSRTW